MQVVWALLQYFLFRVKCTFVIDVIFLLSFKNYTRGHPGSNQEPLALQMNALPLSCIPAACIFNNITAKTCRLFDHCYNVFCSESSVLSRSMSFFSSLSKIIQGDTRVRTKDLSDCSRMLYHWAIIPLHTDSIKSLQTRAGCLSTVTIFFVPSQVYFRDRCHFSLVFQKLYKRKPGFEPGTSRTAAEWSATELYSRCIQIQYHYCKHVQVVWALLQCFLFRVKCSLAIDVHFLSSFKNYTRGHPGSNQEPLALQMNALPLSCIPAACIFNNITAKTCRLFDHCYNVFCSESSVLSRSMSFFSSLSKIIQGTTRFEPGTSRIAAECSTTELYPRCIQIQ